MFTINVHGKTGYTNVYIVSCQYVCGEEGEVRKGGGEGKLEREREGGEILRKYIKIFVIECQNFNFYPSNMQFITSQ